MNDEWLKDLRNEKETKMAGSKAAVRRRTGIGLSPTSRYYGVTTTKLNPQPHAVPAVAVAEELPSWFCVSENVRARLARGGQTRPPFL